MTLSEARQMARKTADETNRTVLVYRDTLYTHFEDFDVAFALPSFGIQEGEPFTPSVRIIPDKAVKALRPELAVR